MQAKQTRQFVKRRGRHIQSERDWVCSICHKSYFNKSTLVHHLKMKHKEDPLFDEMMASIGCSRGEKSMIKEAKVESAAQDDLVEENNRPTKSDD